MVNFENDHYICNIEFYIISQSDVSQFKNLKQLLQNLENDLKAFYITRTNKQITSLGIIYNKFITQISNTQTLYTNHVDELIKIHTKIQLKFSDIFTFNKDVNKNLSKTKKKLEDYTLSRKTILKTYKNVSNQLNEQFIFDKNIKIVNYVKNNLQYFKIILPDNYVNIHIEEFNGKKCLIEGNIIQFPYIELETLNFPVKTDLIYNYICNDNIIFNINCKDKYLESNFDTIEHVNYYTVVITDINRFKIIVSSNLLNVMKFYSKNIRLTLHFKNE